MGQKTRIIEYLQTHETISPMEAWNLLGITKLSTRIGEIESRGYFTFRRIPVKTKNRYGETVRYMTYKLDKR